MCAPLVFLNRSPRHWVLGLNARVCRSRTPARAPSGISLPHDRQQRALLTGEPHAGGPPMTYWKKSPSATRRRGVAHRSVRSSRRYAYRGRSQSTALCGRPLSPCHPVWAAKPHPGPSDFARPAGSANPKARAIAGGLFVGLGGAKVCGRLSGEVLFLVALEPSGVGTGPEGGESSGLDVGRLCRGGL